MYWANLNPHTIPVKDVLAFNEYVENTVEQHKDLIKGAVGEAISEVLSNM
jgi:hypothetical protein